MRPPTVPTAQLPPSELSSELPVVSERRRVRWPRLGCFVGLTAVLLGVTIAGLGVRLALTGGYIRPAGQVPESRNQARTDEEELVKRYILNNAEKDAGKVKFLTWGPHMGKQELLDLSKEGDIGEFVPFPGHLFSPFVSIRSATMIVRVRYEGPDSPSMISSPVAIDGQPLPDPWTGTEDPAIVIQRRIPMFRSNGPRTYDDLFIVGGKHVSLLGRGSDDWKPNLRKELSKRFPGVKK